MIVDDRWRGFRVHTAEVIGSNPVAPTLRNPWSSAEVSARPGCEVRCPAEAIRHSHPPSLATSSASEKGCVDVQELPNWRQEPQNRSMASPSSIEWCSLYRTGLMRKRSVSSALRMSASSFAPTRGLQVRAASRAPRRSSRRGSISMVHTPDRQGPALRRTLQTPYVVPRHMRVNLASSACCSTDRR